MTTGSIKNFQQLTASLNGAGQKRRVAVVWPADQSTLLSVERALKGQFVEAVFVGCREQVEAHFGNAGLPVEIVDAADAASAASKGVALVREGKADVLMKGMVGTDVLLHAVLNRETGILPRGRVLTHITAAQISGYDKLIFFTDPAVIPYPTADQRREQLRYLLGVCRRFGISEPRVSLIHCTEKVGEKFFPFTVEYRQLVDEANRGDYGPCIVDGPLDLKTSLSRKAMQLKGIKSPIDGQADALIFPDIEAGNVFYKTITFFPGTETAAMLQGTLAPVVLPSRGDSDECKYLSIALAALSYEQK